MIGWHHQHNGHEFEQTPGDNEGQGSLVCYSPWGCKESDTTEQLNNNMGSTSPTRDRTWAPCIRSVESYPVFAEPPGKFLAWGILDAPNGPIKAGLSVLPHSRWPQHPAQCQPAPTEHLLNDLLNVFGAWTPN